MHVTGWGSTGLANAGTGAPFFNVNHLAVAKGTASPVSAIAGTPTGGGYWITTESGFVGTLGNAEYFGTPPSRSITPALPVIGVVHTADTECYWLIGSDGGVFAFGDAGFVGSLPGVGVTVDDIVGAVPTTG